MRILVTNDDGVESPGIRALAVALHAAGHELFVVAPSGEHSGAGAAIGRLHRSGPIPCTVVEWAELPGVPVHAIDAPPAAAVYVACAGILGPRPDLVASGVNPGANTGHLVLHSGTVGAALPAATLGIPAIAASLAWADTFHFDTAATIAASAVDWVTGSDGSNPASVRVLSVNAPNVALDEVKGVREARLATFDERWRGEQRPGEIVLEYDGRSESDPDTDVALLRAGYATVTALAGVTPAAASGAAGAMAHRLASLGSPA